MVGIEYAYIARKHLNTAALFQSNPFTCGEHWSRVWGQEKAPGVANARLVLALLPLEPRTVVSSGHPGPSRFPTRAETPAQHGAKAGDSRGPESCLPPGISYRVPKRTVSTHIAGGTVSPDIASMKQ